MADHRLAYITARAMFDGDIPNESFAPHMFSDPNILAFMQKITVREDPNLTARVGSAPTRVTAILADGQRISREVDYAPGFAERPMNRSEVERKFRGNVGKHWPRERTDTILRALWGLDQRDEAAEVVIVTRPELQKLQSNGKVLQGSLVNIAGSALGVAVRKGAPKPDISNVEAFKRALLSARSIGFRDPATGSTSGTYTAG